MTDLRFVWPQACRPHPAVRAVIEHAAPVTACRFALDDGHLVSVDERGLVLVSDPASGAVRHTWRGSPFPTVTYGPTTCATGPGGLVAVATADRAVHVLRVAGDALVPLRTFEPGGFADGPVADLGFFADGKRFLVRHEGNRRVRIEAVDVGAPLLDVRSDHGWPAPMPVVVTGVLALADGPRIATWDLGDPVRRDLAAHDSSIVALGQLDGLLVSTEETGVVRTWDPRTGEPIAAFIGARGIPEMNTGSGRIVIPLDEGVRICDPRGGDDAGAIARYRRRSARRRRLGDALYRVGERLPAVADRALGLSFHDMPWSCRAGAGLAWILTARRDEIVEDQLVHTAHELAFLDATSGSTRARVRLPGSLEGVFAGRGPAAVTTVGDGTVYGFDATGEQRYAVPVTDDDVTAVAAAFHGPVVAVGDRAGKVRLVDPTVAGPVDDDEPRAAHMVDGLVADDGTWAATATAGRTVVVWDLTDGHVRHVFRAHRTGVFRSAIRIRMFSGVDGRGVWLAHTDDDGLVRVRDPRTGARITLVEGEGGELVAASGTWLASAEPDGGVRLLDPRTGRVVHRLTAHSGAVTRASADTAGDLLATRGRDGTRLWSTREGRPLVHLEPDATTGGWDDVVLLDPHGRWLASAGRITLDVHNVPSGTLVHRADTPVRVTAADVDPTGEVLVTGHVDGTVVRRAPSGGTAQVVQGTGHDTVRTVAVSPTGHRVAVGDSAGLVQVADLRTGVVTGTAALGEAVWWCRWLPDGTGVLVAGRAGLDLIGAD